MGFASAKREHEWRFGSILAGEELEEVGLEAQGADGVGALFHVEGLFQYLFKLLEHLSDFIFAVHTVGVGDHLPARILHTLFCSASFEPPVLCA